MLEALEALVAREAELASILDHTASIRTDGLVNLAIRGEAGIGKTCLLSCLCGELRERGWQVLSLEADDLRRRTPYGAVIAGCRAFASQSLYAESLRTGAVRALDILAVDPATDPALWFGRAAESMTRLLSALVATGPLAICVDDAGLLDPDSAALISALVSRLAAAPVALITTNRRGPSPVDLPGSVVIDLGPLSVSAVAAVTAPVLGCTPDDRLAQELHSRSDGNPLLALELARSLALGQPSESAAGPAGGTARRTHRVDAASGDCRENGATGPADGLDTVGGLSRGTFSSSGDDFFPHNGHRNLGDPGHLGDLGGPGDLGSVGDPGGLPGGGRLRGREALVGRFARLDDDAAAVARVVAVLGLVRIEQLGLLAGIMRLPEATVAAAFDELVGQDLLRPRDGGYAFGHELIREALYDQTGPGCRRLVHREVARQLTDDRRRGIEVDLLELAWHVSESASPGDTEAVELLTEAAGLAKAIAPERAVELTARALVLAIPADPRTPILQSIRCRALARTGRPADAVEPGLSALATLPSGDDRSRTLTAVLGSLFSAGRTGEALTVVDTELTRSTAARHHVADAPSQVPDTPAGSPRAERAAVIRAQRGPDGATAARAERGAGGEATLRAQRALLLVFEGQDAEAAAEAERAERAIEGAAPAEAVVAHSQLAMVMSMLVRQDRLIEQADAALVAAGSSDLLRRQALALGACATSLSGFVADATARLRQAESTPPTGTSYPGTGPRGTSPSDTSPSDTSPSDTSPSDTGPSDTGPSGPDPTRGVVGVGGRGAGAVFGAELLVARIAVDWLGGEWDAALRGIGRARREARIGQQPLLTGAVRAIELDIRAWRGEPDHAARLAARPAPTARNMADLYALARANHLAELGDVDGALKIVDGRFMGIASPPYACVLLGRRAELELVKGVRPDTDRLVEVATDRPSPWAQTVLYRATGLAHQDAKALRRSVEIAEAGGLVFERARSELALGMVDGTATDDLTAAYKTFQRLGAHGLRRTAGARLRELGAKVPRARSHPAGRLTETEERMARLVQQGMRNREIATALHYSPRSVEVYLSRIYAKLGISSRLELARVLDGQAGARV